MEKLWETDNAVATFPSRNADFGDFEHVEEVGGKTWQGGGGGGGHGGLQHHQPHQLHHAPGSQEQGFVIVSTCSIIRIQ